MHVSTGQATFALEEVVGAPEYTWRLLYSPTADALFVTTYNGTVYKFDGSTWQLVLDTGINRFCFLNLDSYGNIYVSIAFENYKEGRLYRSNDSGNTWSIVFRIKNLQIWHITDMFNGTLLADNWVWQGPFIWRSDDKGENWYMWKNLTEVFPQYAEPSTRFPPYLIRHIHFVVYDQYAGKIIVGTGDDVKHLFITSDGETWEEIKEYGGYHNAMVLEDRILYCPSFLHGITIYDKNTDTYRIVYSTFGVDKKPFRIDDFVYDNSADIIYAGIMAYPGGYYQQTDYGIVYSSDRGETWNTKFQGKATEEISWFLVFLSIFHDYLYVSMGPENDGKIYRIPLTKSADLNGDGKVNILDIAIIVIAYGSKPGDLRWNPQADVDGNGQINIIDVAMAATEFGKELQGF